MPPQGLTVTKTAICNGDVAGDNVASIRVLEKCGFRMVRREKVFAEVRGEEIEEVLMQLD